MATLGDIGKPAVLRDPKQWSTQYHGVTAAQTFVVGDHVYLDGSGTLAICAASGNDVGNIELLGIAAANAADILARTGDQALCPVSVPGPGAEFLIQLYHGTAASAVLAASDMDAPPILPLRNQGGIWVANVENDGTNDRIVITERHLHDAFSTQYGWFWCKYDLTHRHDYA